MYLAKSLAEKLYLFQVMMRPEGEGKLEGWSGGNLSLAGCSGHRVGDKVVFLAFVGGQVNSLSF